MNKHFQQLKLSHKLLPLLPTLLIAITVTWADYSLARSMQDAAVYSARNFTSANNTLWFQGSWGFQYYMQQYGAKRLVINESVLKKGDILVMPTNNSNIFSVPRNLFEVVEIKEFETTQLASVLSYKTGAGFYTSLFGSLPYVLGKGNLERYYILRAAEPWKAVITKD